MEEELRNLIKVWISALISISYCYYISSKVYKGVLRLFSLLPIFLIFLSSSSPPLFCPLLRHLSFLPHMARKLQAPSLCFRSRTFKPISLKSLPFLLFRLFSNQNPSSNRFYNKHMSKWVLAFKVLIFLYISTLTITITVYLGLLS